MKSTYQRKLFRLFLLFSILPALGLAIAGYYLTTEETLSTLATHSPVAAATNYYNDFLFQRITRELDGQIEGKSTAGIHLDFCFISCGIE